MNDICPTILASSSESHAVCYGISSYDSNAMKSSNPHSGIYEADTARTLDLNGGNPSCNQGGVLVLERKITAFTQNQREEVRDLGNIAGSLAAESGIHQQNLICIGSE